MATSATPTAAASPQTPAPMSVDTMLAAYRTMMLIRRFEEKAGQLYGMGLIGGFCHLYIGQEAVVTGVQMALSDGDQVVTSYRDHGHMLATGMGTARRHGRTHRPPRRLLARQGRLHAHVLPREELLRRPRHRRRPGQHRHRHRLRQPTTAATIASASPISARGASNQGQVYESFNIAALQKLPVIYVIENNRYGMGTSVERSSASHDLSRNGAPWGIPGQQVDGMNVAAVNAAATAAVAHCRSGAGPTLLEMQTYRYRGHSMSDPGKYRTRDEITRMRSERDCIEQVRHAYTEAGGDLQALKAIDDDIKRQVNDAAEFAQSSPEPDPSELWTDILAPANVVPERAGA